MDQNALNLVYANRDAIATNRGFYFQYLTLLKKWIANFVKGDDRLLQSEVGEDIKEIGDELIFTQLKCYTSAFNLNSKEIKKALYAFFLNYLKVNEQAGTIAFVFETNTSVAKNDTLLRQWIDEYPLANGELKDKCARRISSILSGEIVRLRKRKVETMKKDAQKITLIKDAYDQLNEELNEVQLTKFTETIRWKFLERSPEVSIAELGQEIRSLLRDKVFLGRPVNILMDALLSEIYRCSQKMEEKERELSNQTIHEILSSTDQQLTANIDIRIMRLFKDEFEELHDKIEVIRKEQLFQLEKITSLEMGKNRKAIPREITLLPSIDVNNYIDRSTELEAIHASLAQRKQLAILAPGGLGKSTLAKLYLNNYHKGYDHLIWLDADLNLAENIKLNESLFSNLAFECDQYNIADLLLALNEVEGNNIMVIDNCDNDAGMLSELGKLKNWRILFCSRMPLKNIFGYRLPSLNFGQAKALFEKHSSGRVHEATLQRFFQFVSYNTLLIELTGKTIFNSLDLDLRQFLVFLEEQQLDVDRLKIDIEMDSSEENVQLFSFLEKTFKISGLSGDENHVLEFIALLPSDDININDLIDIAGTEFKEKNTLYFINNITRLAQKGLLERNENKVTIHKIIQDTIIYRLRSENVPFAGSMFFINWLIRRFEEGFISDAGKSIRFYKYGASILNAIKEPYREFIYQPLLRLENEVLYVNNVLISSETTTDKWKSLEQRASKFLSGHEPFLGSIRMNYGMSLAQDGFDQEAIQYYKSAANIFRKNIPLALSALIVVLTNLSLMFAQDKIFEEVNLLMEEIVGLRKKYSIPNDQPLVSQHNALALAYQLNGDLTKANEFFRLAIHVHTSLHSQKRNDIFHIGILSNLSINLFLQKKFDEAISNQLSALRMVESLHLQGTSLFKETLNRLYGIYMNIGKLEEASALKKKYFDNYNVTPSQ